MSQRALIVIDLQNDYFPGGKWTLSGIDAAADNAARLLQAFRAKGELVVHIRHENAAHDAPVFVAGTAGAQLNSKVENQANEAVVVKQFPNAFRGTDLKEILDRNAITDLVICGAMSQMCVDSGTRAAADLGYKCTVIHDACAAKEIEFNGVHVPAQHVHAAFMMSLAMGFAACIATEEFLS